MAKEVKAGFSKDKLMARVEAFVQQGLSREQAYDRIAREDWQAAPVVYSPTNLPPHPGLDFMIDEEVVDEAGEILGYQRVKQKSLTEQAHLLDSDINHIMAKYERTGDLPLRISAQPQYGDFVSPGTFQDSMNVIRFAQEQFDALDAPVRKRFGNDPMQFLEFVNDKANIDEAERLGLLKPEVVEARKAARQEALIASANAPTGGDRPPAGAKPRPAAGRPPVAPDQGESDSG